MNNVDLSGHEVIDEFPASFNEVQAVLNAEVGPEGRTGWSWISIRENGESMVLLACAPLGATFRSTAGRL